MREYPATPATPPSTTPTKKKFHGTALRGIDSVATSFSTAGRFGRMFRNIPVFDHKADNLAALARTMIIPADPKDSQPVPTPAPPMNERTP